MAVSIIAAALAAGTAIYGYSEKKKAQRAAAANVRPTYQIPQTEWDNLSLLGSQAGNGLDAGSRQAYLNNADRGLAATIGATQREGGGANATGSAYDSYLNNLSGLTVLDDQRHQQNLQNYVGDRARMSNYQDKAWMLNQYGPWADKAQALNQQIAASDKTMWSGINSFGGALGNFASGMKSSNMGAQSGGGGGSAGGGNPAGGGGFGGGAPAMNFIGPTGGGGSAGGYSGGGTLGVDGPGYDELNGLSADDKHSMYNNWAQYNNVA